MRNGPSAFKVSPSAGRRRRELITPPALSLSIKDRDRRHLWSGYGRLRREPLTGLIKLLFHFQIPDCINDLSGELQCLPAIQIRYGDLGATMEKHKVRTITVLPASYDGNIGGAFDGHVS